LKEDFLMKRLAAVLSFLFLVSAVAQVAGSASQRQRERDREDSIEYALEGDCQRNYNYMNSEYSARAVSEDRQTISRGAVAVLDVQGSRNGGVSIRGWDRADIVVKACKFAAADDEATAQALLNQITVSTEGGRVRAIEPTERPSGRGSWVVQFSIFVPRDLQIEASVHNGGLALSNLTGKVTGRAQNGGISISRSGGVESPIELYTQNGGISLNDVEGRVNAKSANGGISLTGGRGDVKLISQNGGITIKLPEGSWAGESLEARSENGGLVLRVPQGFSSGIEAETSRHARIDCRLADCPQYQAEGDRGPNRVQIGGSPIVRVSSRNGSLQIVPAR
jgi:hypothetical protein